MPKYKNNKEKAEYLENLVLLLEKIISGSSAIIQKNILVKDITGLDREFDIWIQQIVGKRNITIAIECKNYKSPISIEKIDAFYTKCKSVPQINKMVYVTTSYYQTGAIHKARDYGIEPYIIKEINLDNGMLEMLLLNYELTINRKFAVFKENPNSAHLLKDGLDYELYDSRGIVLTESEVERFLKKDKTVFKYLEVNSSILINYKKKVYPKFNTQGLFLRRKDGKSMEIEYLHIDADIEFKAVKNIKENTKSYSNVLSGESLAQISEYEFDVGLKKVNVNIVKNDNEYILHSNEANTYETLKNEKEFTIQELQSQIEEIKKVETKNIEYKYNFDLNSIPIDDNMSMDIFNQREKRKLNVFVTLNTSNNILSFQIPIKLKNNKMFIGKFPDPLRMYINSAIDFHNIAENIMAHVTTASTNNNEPLMYSDGDYFRYIQYKISSLFMLKSAIEFYINALIPDIYKYDNTVEKEEIVKYFSIEEKIYKVIPQMSAIDFKSNEELIENITFLCNLSNRMQNLESSNTIDKPYYESFAELLALDLENEITNVRTFFKKVNGVEII